jgi:hypothetical protein
LEKGRCKGGGKRGKRRVRKGGRGDHDGLNIGHNYMTQHILWKKIS